MTDQQGAFQRAISQKLGTLTWCIGWSTKEHVTGLKNYVQHMRSNQNPFMVNKSYIMCIFCITKVTSIVNTVPNTVFKLKPTYWICLFPESIYVVTLTNRIQNPGAVFNTHKKEEKKRTRKDRGSPRLFLLKAYFLEQSSLPDIALRHAAVIQHEHIYFDNYITFLQAQWVLFFNYANLE